MSTPANVSTTRSAVLDDAHLDARVFISQQKI